MSAIAPAAPQAAPSSILNARTLGLAGAIAALVLILLLPTPQGL